MSAVGHQGFCETAGPVSSSTLELLGLEITESPFTHAALPSNVSAFHKNRVMCEKSRSQKSNKTNVCIVKMALRQVPLFFVDQFQQLSGSIGSDSCHKIPSITRH